MSDLSAEERAMSEEIVRVLRVIEYVGPRSRVERTVEGSIQGTRDCGNGLKIRTATVGSFPELLNTEQGTDE